MWLAASFLLFDRLCLLDWGVGSRWLAGWHRMDGTVVSGSSVVCSGGPDGTVWCAGWPLWAGKLVAGLLAGWLRLFSRFAPLLCPFVADDLQVGPR